MQFITGITGRQLCRFHYFHFSTVLEPPVVTPVSWPILMRTRKCYKTTVYCSGSHTCNAVYTKFAVKGICSLYECWPLFSMKWTALVRKEVLLCLCIYSNCLSIPSEDSCTVTWGLWLAGPGHMVSESQGHCRQVYFGNVHWHVSDRTCAYIMQMR